jgi:hypothetical protein
MQQQLTLNFSLSKNFFLIYRTLSMWQKTKNNRNQGSNAKKIFFFGFVPKSPTQMGSLSAKNASKKVSRLGTFKETPRMKIKVTSSLNETSPGQCWNFRTIYGS